MKAIKIYVAHALTLATESYRKKMRRLRMQIGDIPGVEILEFAWEKGPEFNRTVNVWKYDMKCVRRADLMVAVMDFISAGTPMEIQTRCQMHGKPLMTFRRPRTTVSKIVTDCIKHYRHRLRHGKNRRHRLMADNLMPMQVYRTHEEILTIVKAWVREEKKRRKAKRS